MGDAKRRKQLGLMPTSVPFEVLADRAGTLTPVRLPTDETQRRQITETLRMLTPGEAGWDQLYRTHYVQAGLPEERLHTREDVEKIPVPPYRRFVGELVTWPAGTQPPPTSQNVPVEGSEQTWLHLRHRHHAFEANTWLEFPEPESVQEMMQYLLQHPASELQGESRGRYTAEQTQDGALTWTPELPEDLRAAFEELAREWHGDTPEAWAEIHAEMVAYDETADPDAVPVAMKTTFELRDPAPLRSLTNTPLSIMNELDVFPVSDERSYSLDGQTWQPYPNLEDENDELSGIDFDDLEMFGVTVWADGRTEWPDDTVPDDRAEKLRADLLAYTGAGNEGAWALYADRTLRSFYDLEDEPDKVLPLPTAIRLSVPFDYLEDETLILDALILEDEITFDGETWFDLYEDLPDDF
ncbi:hypothetical protein MF271_13805 [Deinococcus sp. KNUC1210]|uniref:hypothetical protein n=1 Tax=Deinococcus sp. KNUC1210 TaxID=2917691 RepID=UPI001EF13465|nr:hypothetical protein [Deinococcus sp. KNUC1210]ULH15024.1 hypothetical protein MF271_13805 [Deinococcus sp. KNUC1210]